MRKTLVAAAAAAILSAGAFLATGANAMTIAAPSGLKAATEGATATEQVAYVCHRVLRHGVYRRVCTNRPNYGYRYGYGTGYGYGYGYPSYGYGYGAYYPYYYRPYGYYGWSRPSFGFTYRY